jgi:hypothetical protein
MYRSNRTSFTGRTYSFGEANWAVYSSKHKPTVPFILWRDSLSESGAQIQEPVLKGQSETEEQVSP